MLVERGAGSQAHFPDQGICRCRRHPVRLAPISSTATAEIITKVAASLPGRTQTHAKKGQIVISALHLGHVKPDFFADFIAKNATGIGFEFIQSTDGGYPIVRMMHEITGFYGGADRSPRYLETNQNGPGLILGGISGVPPATVTILGAGIIAEYAARTAMGYGAQVFVLDTDLGALRRLENALDRRIITGSSQSAVPECRSLSQADVVIGAV